MTVVLRRRLLVPFSCFALLAACAGDGSDIGPRLPRIPDESSKILLFDDDNHGVVSATVALAGTTTSALTGRNGRGDFLATPRGRLLFDVDPSWAAATAGDTLGGYRVALSVTGPDAPTPLHVPTLLDSASAVVNVGLQANPVTISSAHGVLTLASGVSVAVEGVTETTSLSLGELSAEHLPGDLPSSGVGTRLFSRGFYVAPLDAAFSRGLDLDVDDDIRATTLSAELFRLDDQTGEWVVVGVATSAAGRLTASGVIERGGLYAFGVIVTDVRSVAGCVVDVVGLPVPDVMVTVDQRHTTTASDGTFLLDDVAATYGDGALRDAQLELYAGGSWLPAIASLTVSGSSSATDVGDVELDTVYAGNVRVQQVLRARADGLQPARLSSVIGDVALSATSDVNGQATFEDVPAGYFGFQEGRRRDTRDVFYGQQVGFLEVGRRWLDSYQFLIDRPWFQGTRSTRGYVCDRVGGGPIEFAYIVEGETADVGYIGETRETGQLFGERGFKRRATATLRTERDGAAITHGFTVEFPGSDHQEFPMRRVLRRSLGNFDRHGYVTGSVTGANSGSSYDTRVTRRMTRQDLWDAAVEGIAVPSVFPVDLAVGPTQSDFRVGLPVAGGNIAVVELVETNGKDRLAQCAVLADVREGIVEGANLTLDAPIPLVASTQFVLQDALAGAPAEVDASSLQLSVGQLVDGAGVVDVARRVDGSVSAAGADLELALPPLSAGAQWILLLGGEQTSASVTSSHYSMVDLEDTTTIGFGFRAFPTLTAPAPGETVAASGFDVEFSLPAGALGGKIELHSEAAGNGDTLIWEVLVPPDEPDFRFVQLPIEAETPLIANRTYTLTVSAWFGTVEMLSPDVYGDFVAFAQSIALIEGGVRQVTMKSIEIQTN